MSDYISPYIHGLKRLMESDGYPTLLEMYQLEKEKILSEFHNADDDRNLRLVQGKWRLLKKIMSLPEDEIDRAIATQRGKKNEE